MRVLVHGWRELSALAGLFRAWCAFSAAEVGRISCSVAASRPVGVENIQERLGGGRVDESKFTHGSSAQREKWFTTGLRTGNPNACNTSDPKVGLG
ncbi:neutral zinc metallopeptidase [Saccharopolyspora sp. NPDC050389]|uniref:neutral zinc metallopeptidase n=1 Tax=Saccharopolyspora sp. NPDC050389 TaxID=3155516 RepID=UPI0033E85C65